MTILVGDIKLVASQVMDDVDNGGGAPTSVELVDGTSNSVFNDISETDRALGRVNLRKLFVHIQTNNVDSYLGANFIVADAPDDPLVSVTLFSTGETFDRRTDAKARVEAYLNAGTTLSAYLFGNHIEGQSSISLLARTTVAPPVVGDTLVLTKLEGTGNEFTQYVRVSNVTVILREFEIDTSGPFVRAEIVLELTDQLRADFPGFDVFKYESAISYTGKTRVRTTVVADAARYYGVQPLSVAADSGDFTIQVPSIFSQLVPSAEIETPIADARLNQQSASLVGGSGPFVQNLSLAFTTTQQMFVGGGILPNTLTVEREGTTLIDNGGKLLNQATTDQVGTVDYSNGVLTLLTNVWGTIGGLHVVTYTPAAQPVGVTESVGVPVTVSSQRLNYVLTLIPVPARASATASYRSQGRWYVLTEDGSGALRGTDSSFGVGTLNFTTGTLSLTLGALPDVGSEVIITYKPEVANIKLGSYPLPSETLANRAFFAIQVPSGIKPNTLTVSWNDGAPRTATDDGLGGLIGSAVGEVNYAHGYVRISPLTLPASGTNFTVDITQGATVESDVPNFTDSGSSWTFTLAGTTRAGSVEFGVACSHANRVHPGIDQTLTKIIRVFDDGLGNLKIASVSGNITVGSVNYGTGACGILKSVGAYEDAQPTYENYTPIGAAGTDATYVRQSGTQTRSLTLTILNGTGATMSLPAWAWWTGSFGVSAKAKRVGTDGSSYNNTAPQTVLVVKRAYRDKFRIGSDFYRKGGIGNQVIRNPSPTTGEGTAAGNVFYTSNGLYGTVQVYGYPSDGGNFSITSWTTGVSPVITDSSGVVQPPVSGAATLALADGVVFRTAISPIKNGSFSVVGTFVDGTVFNVTADSNGEIATGTNYTGPGVPGSYGVFGKVNYDSGVVKIRFGRRVHPSSAGSTGVVDMSDLGLSGVQYVEVKGVQSDTLRYNASAFVYLPLDADLLGIDPVRLPSDGRVPIYRPGSVVVIGNSQNITGTVTNGQVVNCGRVRLSRVRVIGNNGVVINTGYTQDLEAGTVTFTNVTGYSQPVTVEHRVEDMKLMQDAQISGLLTFTSGLTHDFPVLGSYVSSALVAGDLKARMDLMFDQLSWSNVWSNVVIGSNATATYNDVAHPLEVSNIGTVTERWALVFTNSTTFNIIGEHVGVIGVGTTSVDQSPLNPATSQPYWTIRATGWGTGWAAGNVLRFNTVGAQYPVWVVRTIRQGPETVPDDSFTLLVRGDIDNP